MDLNIEDFLPKYPNINNFTLYNKPIDKKEIIFGIGDDEEWEQQFQEGDEGEEEGDQWEDDEDEEDWGDEEDEWEYDEDKEDDNRISPKKRQTDYNLSFMNPYEDDFYTAIFKKKEFYDERLSETETIPTEKGMLMKHQKIISRFLSSYSLYDGILLVHEMGSGKTCTAIAAIERIKNERLEGKNNFKGCYIFAKGTNILNNFVKELRDKCTAGEYVPEGYFPKNEDPITGEKRKMKLTNTELNIRTKKLFENFYNISINQKPTTFETIAKYIHNTPDNVLINRFSNCILVIDEVHNLRIQDVTDDKISMYAEFHRLLHMVKNCKILLLSGTPMKDEASEIASVMNLILPLDKQLPVGTDFENKFLEKNEVDNSFYFTINLDTEEELKSYFKGRVSFLKAMKSNVKKVFIGEEEQGNLKYLKVDPIYMSVFQTEHYIKALNKDRETEKDKKSGVYYNSRQASLFVFPDGSYGQPKNEDGSVNTKKGFSKYIKQIQDKKIFISQKKKVYTYMLDSEFSKLLTGKDNEETIKNIEKYSCKYAQVLRSVLSSNKSCFIYCDQVSGSGAILLSKLFGLLGFSEATGKEGDVAKPRYVLLSSEMTSTRMSEVIDMFNNPKNLHGDLIKVIIGSKIVSEGLSFNNVQQEFILTPWFNYSETEQAIARGLRLGSHRDLIENGENPTVEISHMVAMPLQEDMLSIDQHMYEISELKDISIKSVNRVLMTSSFDCALNYFRNRSSTNEDLSRDCEYQECAYGCDGIDDDDLEFGFEDSKIDKSTYNVYYSNPKIPLVRRRIEEILRNYKEISLKLIIQKLGEEHTEYEIKNALKTLLKTTGSTENSIRYLDYIQVYNLSNVKILMNTIEKLFKNFFRLSLKTIKEKLIYDGNKNFKVIYTNFEIVSALKTIIDENIIMYNKYGLPSYLRENNDMYFLVSSVSSPSSLLLNYYAHSPTVKTGLTFLESLKKVQKEILPKYVKKLSKVSDKEMFNKMIKNVPIEVQEMFIETSLLEEREQGQEQDKENKPKSKINQFIQEYFSNYIFKVDDEWISTLLKEEYDVLRCLQKDKWENCETDYSKKIKSKKQNVKVDLENNPWGYYAKINPENGVFNIVNVIDQKQKEEKKKILVQKREEELKELLRTSKITKKQYDAEMLKGKDHRDVFPGRNCREGWELTKLYEIVIKTLKLDYPSEYRENESLDKLKTEIKAHKHIHQIFTEQELKNLNSKETRRALYWGRKETKSEGKTGGKIKTLCDILEEWFRKNNLFVYDNEAGTSGGHKKKEDENKEEITFRTEIFTPSKHYQRMEQYFKYIDKVSKECLGLPLKVNEKDTDTWFLVFNKKKLACFIVLHPETNLIKDVCVSNFFSKKEKSSDTVKEGMKTIYTKTGTKPKLIVENNLQTYNELLKMYLSYGFVLTKNDGRLTTLEMKNEE